MSNEDIFNLIQEWFAIYPNFHLVYPQRGKPGDNTGIYRFASLNLDGDKVVIEMYLESGKIRHEFLGLDNVYVEEDGTLVLKSFTSCNVDYPHIKMTVSHGPISFLPLQVGFDDPRL